MDGHYHSLEAVSERRALERMTRDTQARMRTDRLRAASHRVRQDSMRVNAEFDAIERDVDA